MVKGNVETSTTTIVEIQSPKKRSNYKTLMKHIPELPNREFGHIACHFSHQKAQLTYVYYILHSYNQVNEQCFILFTILTFLQSLHHKKVPTASRIEKWV